jgi:hypothetical protein
MGRQRVEMRQADVLIETTASTLLQTFYFLVASDSRPWQTWTLAKPISLHRQIVSLCCVGVCPWLLVLFHSQKSTAWIESIICEDKLFPIYQFKYHSELCH